MKKLGLFLHFDSQAFFSHKRLICIGGRVWSDPDSGKILGTKLDIVIAQDKTNYQSEEYVTNLYEKFVLKVPRELKIPFNAEIRMVNPESKVYGDYRNQLSVTADNIEIIGKKE